MNSRPALSDDDLWLVQRLLASVTTPPTSAIAYRIVASLVGEALGSEAEPILAQARLGLCVTRLARISREIPLLRSTSLAAALAEPCACPGVVTADNRHLGASHFRRCRFWRTLAAAETTLVTTLLDAARDVGYCSPHDARIRHFYAQIFAGVDPFWNRSPAAYFSLAAGLRKVK